MSIKLLKRLSCGIISGVCCCLFCLLLATAANADVCFLPTGQCEAASADLSTGCSGFNLTGAKDETGWNCTQCGEKWKCEKKSCKDDYKTDVRCSGTETKVCDETRKAGDESCCKCEDSVTKCQHEGYVYKTTNTNENCTGKCPYNSDYYESCECNAKYDKASDANACYAYNTCELGDLAGTKKYEQTNDVHKCKDYMDNAEYVTDNSEQVKSDDYDCTLVCTETCDNSNRKYYQCSPKNNDCTGCDYCIAGTCKDSGENRIISDSSTYEKCADSCGGKYRCKTGYTAKYAGSNQYKCVPGNASCDSSLGEYERESDCKIMGWPCAKEGNCWKRTKAQITYARSNTCNPVLIVRGSATTVTITPNTNTTNQQQFVDAGNNELSFGLSTGIPSSFKIGGPDGTTTLTVTVTGSSGTITIGTYNFKAGKSYQITPNCNDGNKVTVYYDAPTDCNPTLMATNSANGHNTSLLATNQMDPGTYIFNFASGGNGTGSSFTIRMGRGGTPSPHSSGSRYTFSAGNEYWIVPSCTSGSGSGSGSNTYSVKITCRPSDFTSGSGSCSITPSSNAKQEDLQKITAWACICEVGRSCRYTAVKVSANSGIFWGAGYGLSYSQGCGIVKDPNGTKRSDLENSVCNGAAGSGSCNYEWQWHDYEFGY